MKSALALSAAVAALAGAAQAAEVEIENAVARVVVIPEARSDIQVEVSGGEGSGLPALKVSRTGSGKVEIDGDLDRRIRGCRMSGIVLNDAVSPTNPPSNLEVEVRDLGQVKLASAPLVTIRTPMDVRIETGGAVFGSIGRSTSVKLGSAGCGDWTIANVAEDLSVAVAGSGDVRAGTARHLKASIAGSGDVRVGAVRSLEASIAGSGDVRVARLDGPVEASIAGSGDVLVEGGRATRVKASIAGSGDVRIAGASDSVEASIIGSGDVRVASAGSVKKSVIGSGSVLVGN